MSVEAVIERLVLGTGARNASRLAELLGVTPGALTNWKSSGRVGTETVVKACQQFGLSETWVFRGAGPMRASDLSQPAILAPRLNEPVHSYGDTERDDPTPDAPKKKLTREEMIAKHTIDDGGLSEIPLSTLAEVRLARLRALRKRHDEEMAQRRRLEDEELAKLAEVLASGGRAV